YKPAAAMVYATAFTMIGTGKDPRTVLMGFTMVFLSLLALPVLMRLFTWTTGHVADASGGGGFLQTALQGAVAVGALRGMSGGAAGGGGRGGGGARGPGDRARRARPGRRPAGSGPAGAPQASTGARTGITPVPAVGAPAGTAAGSAAAAPAARAGAASGAAVA